MATQIIASPSSSLPAEGGWREFVDPAKSTSPAGGPQRHRRGPRYSGAAGAARSVEVIVAEARSTPSSTSPRRSHRARANRQITAKQTGIVSPRPVREGQRVKEGAALIESRRARKRLISRPPAVRR
jgi:multidrug efflux pump subunit AcrA (membrane-fusion protein)